MADDEETYELRAFDSHLVKTNSVITIIGKKTNLKAIYKDYGKYFDSLSQLKNIMASLKDNQSLVIDETNPKNQIQDLLYIYGK